ncbi:N-formylglutamate amidohydrolase [Novosphingobium lentum]|uniref:N-formylglutamate amidohydrolase n=1 Tax=Novosphingobium lentum TaxID=145287 RepID=UPI00083057CB|nr:N-formylglutamate amidohydrolase [Novosphingobium lentum]
MTKASDNADDSQLVQGGIVPGHPGVPAYSLRRSAASPIPVLIAVPHAGRAYASTLLDRMRNPAFAAPRLEDRFVDLLADAVARRTGAALLVAHAPRALIDLNRATDDIDWDMMGMPAPDASAMPVASFGRRARSGLGLVPRRLPGLGELWKRRMDHAELDDRIAGVHVPYHAALAETLHALHARWGAALLIDLHSMPPLPARSNEPSPEFVVGDRFGVACDGALIAEAFSYFAEIGRRAAHNRPYAGGYVLERHARRGEGVHALQLEIDRQCYLDSRLAEPGPRFAEMVDLLVGLVQRLAGDVAALGGDAGGAPMIRDAAE